MGKITQFFKKLFIASGKSAKQNLPGGHHKSESRRQKRQAEAAIQFERNLLRTLIDNLPDFIYVKDSDCRIIVANKSSIEFMGYTNESQIIGKTDLDIFTDENGNRGYAQDLAVVQTGHPILNREEEFVDARGVQRWLLTTKIPIYNEHGKIIGTGWPQARYYNP